MMEPAATLPVDFLFELRLTGAAQPDFAFSTPWGDRQERRARGGTFAGPRLRGTVIEGLANDWGAVSSDGTVGLDANIVLNTDDHEAIFMQFRGRQDQAGHIRVAAMFEASSGPNAWLTEYQAIGVGNVDGPDLVLDIYNVL